MLSKRDERAFCLFKKGEIDNKFVNEYESIIEYLKKVEDARTNPFNFQRIKYKILLFVMKLLNKTKTKNTAASLYFQFKSK